MPTGNATRTTIPSFREEEEHEAQQRLDEAEVVFGGDRPSKDRVIAAAVLQMAFPSVAPERLKEAAEVLAEATSGPDDELNPERLDLAALKIADVFAAE
jgi:hypothetical protein